LEARRVVGVKVAVEPEHVTVPAMPPDRVKVDVVTVAQFNAALKVAEST
jgi:hypothetical protein